MEETNQENKKIKKIKKIDMLYLLGYIFIPIVVCVACFELSALFFPKGNMAVVLLMGPSILSFIWWCFGGTLLFKQKQKKFFSELDEKKFERNHTFYGRGSTVVVDAVNGSVAILFFWNPFESFIVPASRVSKAWVDDGKGGAGFLEGSSRVSFLFTIDDVTIRVNTFTSNQRWRMDSEYILTGISKADMMVEVIEAAKSTAGVK